MLSYPSTTIWFMVATSFNTGVLLWIVHKWGAILISCCCHFLLCVWRLNQSSYIFCSLISSPPAKIVRKLACVLGGPDASFPCSAPASQAQIQAALCDLTPPASCWFLDTLSQNPELFDNILPFEDALDTDAQHQVPVKVKWYAA
ncbi:hypothetical protein DSO57_1008732 [Entomophthora muscae]|uniref:Uncharacterized protein n=1 Tax=Entomophthora muscae TaxID=34485 RepID=A0ACC2THZ0_9FUNG|nr:hypothetical protein DSO57_1008732 [Entomophthora muscae]